MNNCKQKRGYLEVSVMLIVFCVLGEVIEGSKVFYDLCWCVSVFLINLKFEFVYIFYVILENRKIVILYL